MAAQEPHPDPTAEDFVGWGGGLGSWGVWGFGGVWGSLGGLGMFGVGSGVGELRVLGVRGGLGLGFEAQDAKT